VTETSYSFGSSPPMWESPEVRHRRSIKTNFR
jgi:hypothetical protein